MKVLILGSNGMLGHKLYQVLTKKYNVIGTIRGNYDSIDKYGFFSKPDIIPNVDAQRIPTVEEVFNKKKPDVVINCIGVIKSFREAQDRLINVWINALFPHQLYQICKGHGARLIHISTDCVFSGKKGIYREDDPSDAEDIYGKTKYLGEIKGEGALTIRSSFIGRELSSTHNLIEWFLGGVGEQFIVLIWILWLGLDTCLLLEIWYYQEIHSQKLHMVGGNIFLQRMFLWLIVLIQQDCSEPVL